MYYSNLESGFNRKTTTKHKQFRPTNNKNFTLKI